MPESGVRNVIHELVARGRAVVVPVLPVLDEGLHAATRPDRERLLRRRDAGLESALERLEVGLLAEAALQQTVVDVAEHGAQHALDIDSVVDSIESELGAETTEPPPPRPWTPAHHMLEEEERVLGEADVERGAGEIVRALPLPARDAELHAVALVEPPARVVPHGTDLHRDDARELIPTVALESVLDRAVVELGRAIHEHVQEVRLVHEPLDVGLAAREPYERDAHALRRRTDPLPGARARRELGRMLGPMVDAGVGEQRRDGPGERVADIDHGDQVLGVPSVHRHLVARSLAGLVTSLDEPLAQHVVALLRDPLGVGKIRMTTDAQEHVADGLGLPHEHVHEPRAHALELLNTQHRVVGDLEHALPRVRRDERGPVGV